MKSIFNTVRLSIIIFALLNLILFCCPMIMGIFNIGNITGALVCLIITFSSIYYYQLKTFLFQLCQTPFFKVIIIILSSIIVLCIICTAILSILMIKAATNSPPNNPTVVVLGCKVNAQTPSLMLKRRLDTALKYLNDNKETLCIVSGGQGDGENITEAQAMYNYLTEKGIDKNRIYMENKSTNTTENIKFSKEIIEHNNLNKNIAIVTDGFHQLRANLIAKDNGLRAYSISAKTPWYTFSTYYIRELYALVEQIVLK